MFNKLLQFLRPNKSVVLTIQNWSDNNGVAASSKKEPLKWKSLIDQNPSEDDFKESWKRIFEFYPKDCVLVEVESGFNCGFTVLTPTTKMSHGGFGEHTETPVLTKESVWHNGGISWGVDDNGTRFYYINKRTLLPVRWEQVKAIEIIKRYIVNNQHKQIFKQLENIPEHEKLHKS